MDYTGFVSVHYKSTSVKWKWEYEYSEGANWNDWFTPE